MADQVLPATADEVVALLDAAFPEQSASLTWTDRQVWFEAGKREVVRFLKHLQQRRDSDLLETT
jgi:hypothetical protein